MGKVLLTQEVKASCEIDAGVRALDFPDEPTSGAGGSFWRSGILGNSRFPEHDEGGGHRTEGHEDRKDRNGTGAKSKTHG
jgi:hypothetical protein